MDNDELLAIVDLVSAYNIIKDAKHADTCIKCDDCDCNCGLDDAINGLMKRIKIAIEKR